MARDRDNHLEGIMRAQLMAINYAVGYLDALAGNAPTEDARESARAASEAIVTRMGAAVRPRADTPDTPDTPRARV